MAQNNLFPVFLKLETLQTLLVGGGKVALEKLNAILKNSPKASVTVVAGEVSGDLAHLAKNVAHVQIFERKVSITDLENIDVLILATNDRSLHEELKVVARKRRILTNVADTPELCDFYLGSVYQQGDLKIGISTNGKSPTMAKRFREFLEEFIPDNFQDLLDNMHGFRAQIKGDFQKKVTTLNELTASIMAGNNKRK